MFAIVNRTRGDLTVPVAANHFYTPAYWINWDAGGGGGGDGMEKKKRFL